MDNKNDINNKTIKYKKNDNGYIKIDSENKKFMNNFI